MGALVNAWPSAVLIGAEKIVSLERFYSDFYPSNWGRHPTLQEFAFTLSWDAGHRLDDAFAYHDLPVVPEAQDEHEYLCALTHFLRKDYEGMQQYLTRLSACEHAAIAQRALMLSLFAIPNSQAGREQRDQLLQHVGTPQSAEEKLFHTLVAAWSAREKEFVPTSVLEILARQELPSADTESDPRLFGAYAVLIGLYTSLYAAASYHSKASEFRELNRKIARPHQLTSFLSYIGLELSEKAVPILDRGIVLSTPAYVSLLEAWSRADTSLYLVHGSRAQTPSAPVVHPRFLQVENYTVKCPIEHIERLRGKRAAQKDSSGLHIVAGFPTQSDRLFVHILRQDGSWDFLNFASKDAPWQSIDGELRISWIVPTPETLKLKPPIENPSWVLCLNGSACLHSAGSVYYVCTDAHTLGWMFEL